MPMPGTVTFDFNPNQISVTRQAAGNQSPRTLGGGGAGGAAAPGSTGFISRGTTQPTYTINNVVLYGPTTKSRCQQLLDWMTPGGGLLGKLAGAALSAATGGAINLASKLPTLTFMWGAPTDAFMCECTLKSCTVVYERFDRSGAPQRAKVNIVLQEEPSLLGLLSTNPTSGGLPGRQVHVVSDGENLQTIATARYGAPGHWRAIADVNGIDDPTRVPAGRRLFLPNPDELLQERN
jgi:nucleoid-associated protein YgaU